MNWTNYHTHSFYCDGSDNLEEYVKKAIDRKMPVIGFSSHASVPFPTGWNMNVIELPDYLNEIEALKVKYNNDIQIYKGLEIDYLKGKNIVFETIELISKSKCIIEINTHGVYKGLCKSFYPSGFILKECSNFGIPVTINADAHHPDELNLFFNECATLLKKKGYKEIFILINNEWLPKKFNENGILI